MDTKQLRSGGNDDAKNGLTGQNAVENQADCETNSFLVAAVEPQSPVPLTRRELLTLVVIFVGLFFGGTVCSLHAPLYPPLATEKGLTPVDTGIVFGIHSLLMCIVPPFAAFMITRTSIRGVMISGCLLLSVTTTLFGFLEWSPAGATFLTLSLVIRIAEGTGISLYVSSVFTYVTVSFPSKFTTLLGTIDLIFSVSNCVGPILGGFLNQVGGFKTPFLLVGGITFLTGMFIIILFVEKQSDTDDDRSVGMIKPLKHIGVFLHVVLNLVNYGIFGFNVATLTYYLLEVNPGILSSSVGLIFASFSVGFGLTSQSTGILMAKLKRPYCLSYIGILLCAVAFVFFGPMWPLKHKPLIWSIVVSEVVFGIGCGLVSVSSLTLSFHEAYAAGLPQGKGTNAAVSSLFMSAAGLGLAIGSFGGGALYDTLGYPVSTTYVVGCILFQFLFLFAFTLSQRRLSVKCNSDK